MTGPETGNYRIVLADDHDLIRQGLKKIIEGVADLEVVGDAGDGLELLALLNTIVPHMVILDISMPNLRGIDAIGEIKMKHPDIKVLILSMYREYFYQALSAGADGYLVKEDSDRELFSAIEHIRREKIYLSPCLTGKLLSERMFSFERLSAREREVFELIAGGKSNEEIAGSLFIGIGTVRSHRVNMMRKLNLNGAEELVKYAMEKRYV